METLFNTILQQAGIGVLFAFIFSLIVYTAANFFFFRNRIKLEIEKEGARLDHQAQEQLQEFAAMWQSENSELKKENSNLRQEVTKLTIRVVALENLLFMNGIPIDTQELIAVQLPREPKR